MQPIPKAQLQKMSGKYEKEIKKAGFPHTRYGYVSKKDLLQLMEDNDADGVRWYMGIDDKGNHTIGFVAVQSHPTIAGVHIEKLTDTDDQKTYFGNAGDIMPICPPTCTEIPPGG